jgi:hypothetical protein
MNPLLGIGSSQSYLHRPTQKWMKRIIFIHASSEVRTGYLGVRAKVKDHVSISPPTLVISSYQTNRLPS